MEATNENKKHRRSNIPSLTCSILASLATGGNTYAFGIYGAELKENLSLTQGQLDTISTSFFVAGLFSGIPGWGADHFGARLSLLWSGVGSAVFLLAYWAVGTLLIPLPSGWAVPVLSILGLCSFLFNSLAIGAIFKTIVATAGRGNTGTAVGAAKGFIGLGSGMYACLFGLIKPPEQSSLDFLLMAAFLAFACLTLPALLLLPTKDQMRLSIMQDETTHCHFRLVYFSLIGMVSIIVGHVILELYSATSMESFQVKEQGEPNYFRAFLLLLAWLGPLLSLLILPKRQTQTLSIRSISSPSEDDPTVGEELPLLRGGKQQAGQVPPRPQEHVIFQHRKDFNLIQMLETTPAQLMLWATKILAGAGTYITNNMGQMAEALDFPSSVVTPASLALFSVAQSVARVVTGSVSEAALEWHTRRFGVNRGVPRPFFFILASAVSVVAHSVLIVATDELLFIVGVFLAGLSFGMIWPIMVLTCGEVFGTKHVGANYMFFDGFTLAVGTLLLSKIVAQDVYEGHIGVAEPEVLTNTCLGTGCFQQTHIIVALLSLTCVFASFGVFYTSRKAYCTLAYRRDTSMEYYK